MSSSWLCAVGHCWGTAVLKHWLYKTGARQEQNRPVRRATHTHTHTHSQTSKLCAPWGFGCTQPNGCACAFLSASRVVLRIVCACWSRHYLHKGRRKTFAFKLDSNCPAKSGTFYNHIYANSTRHSLLFLTSFPRIEFLEHTAHSILEVCTICKCSHPLLYRAEKTLWNTSSHNPMYSTFSAFYSNKWTRIMILRFCCCLSWDSQKFIHFTQNQIRGCT